MNLVRKIHALFTRFKINYPRHTNQIPVRSLDNLINIEIVILSNCLEADRNNERTLAASTGLYQQYKYIAARGEFN